MSNDESSFDSIKKKSQDLSLVFIIIFSNLFAKPVRSSSHYSVLCRSNVVS
jgi:hypothetical protein